MEDFWRYAVQISVLLQKERNPYKRQRIQCEAEAAVVNMLARRQVLHSKLITAIAVLEVCMLPIMWLGTQLIILNLRKKYRKPAGRLIYPIARKATGVV